MNFPPLNLWNDDESKIETRSASFVVSHTAHFNFPSKNFGNPTDKRSLNRAIEAGQGNLISMPPAALANTPTPYFSKPVQQHGYTRIDSFASPDNDLQNFFDSVNFHEAISTITAPVDEINYPTPETSTSGPFTLTKSNTLAPPPLLQDGGQGFAFDSLGVMSPMHITPPNNTTRIGFSTRSPVSYAGSHQSTTRELSGHAVQGGTQSRPRSQHMNRASTSSSELNAYTLNAQVTNLETSDLEVTSDDGLHPLHIAAQGGHERIVRILLERDVWANEKDGDGKTALHFAAFEGHDAVVRMLLAHGARVGEADFEGRTSLHWAVLHRQESVLRILLDHSSSDHDLNIDAFNKNGRTALHTAIERGFDAGLQLLLQHGANFNIRAKCK